MKLGETKRFKTIDLHVLLLEDCIMLLQRQDDKYLLKVRDLDLDLDLDMDLHLDLDLNLDMK